MDLKQPDGQVYVTLSRRNLLELLAELDLVASDPRAAGMVPSLNRMTKNGHLVVEAQEDDAHYGGRTPGTFGMVNW